jgi:nicotinamide-nucleotide amidase
MFPADVKAQAQELVDLCQELGLQVTTAESCTGGLLGGLLTSIPGSSKIYDCGFITYSNRAKRDVLGISSALLRAHGAVSAEVARAMAENALKLSGADLAVAITGIAGPGGGSEDKPVGLVHFGTAHKQAGLSGHVERFGDLGRDQVRLQSVRMAIGLLLGLVKG